MTRFWSPFFRTGGTNARRDDGHVRADRLTDGCRFDRGSNNAAHTSLTRLKGAFQHQRFGIIRITCFPQIGIVH